MSRKYTEWFSVTVTHDFYEDGYSRDFSFAPTEEGRRQLKNLGLLFRETPHGFKVYYEKTGPDFGEIPRRIRRPVGFSFYMKWKNPHLLNYTDLGPPSPLFHGRQCYYFTNIDRETGAVDYDVDSGGRMLLSVAAEVGPGDRYALVPETFSVPVDPSRYNEVEVYRTDPGIRERKLFSTYIEDKTFLVQLDFRKYPDGRYRTKWLGMNSREEELYVGNAGLRESAFGIIEIFKDADSPYDPPVGYFLEFRRSSHYWKYAIRSEHADAIGQIRLALQEGAAVPPPYPADLRFERIDLEQLAEALLRLSPSQPAPPDLAAELERLSLKRAEVIDLYREYGSGLVLFRSDRVLPCFEKPLRQLSLTWQADGVSKEMPDLPNPKWSDPKRLVFLTLRVAALEAQP